MAKYVCIQKTYFNNTLYKPGDIHISDKEPTPEAKENCWILGEKAPEFSDRETKRQAIIATLRGFGYNIPHNMSLEKAERKLEEHNKNAKQ